MVSRRNFVKTLLAALAATAGGATAWQVWGKQKAPAASAAPSAANGKEPLLSFFLLSDIHATTGNAGITEKLHVALKDLARFESPIDTVVLGGDLVDGGREEDYQLLQEVLSAYHLPKLYANMGNHEYYHIWYDQHGDWVTANGPNPGKLDSQARERFLRYMGQDRVYHDAWVGGVHLIMLSQEAYVQERPEVGEGAWYSDQQLAWLAETLKPHADGKPALLFIHQPLAPAGADGGQHRVIRNKEFRAILEPYRNLFVFSGHTHQNLENPGHYVRDTTFHWFSNASVGKTRAGGSVANPIQGMYVQVYSDRVVVRGREFSNRTWIATADWTVDFG